MNAKNLLIVAFISCSITSANCGDKFFKNFFNDQKDIKISETKESSTYSIEIVMPGFKQDDIKIQLSKDSMLKINAENREITKTEKNEHENNKKYIYRSEKQFVKIVSKAIKLPDDVNLNKGLTYSYQDGKLQIECAKK